MPPKRRGRNMRATEANSPATIARYENHRRLLVVASSCACTHARERGILLFHVAPKARVVWRRARVGGRLRACAVLARKRGGNSTRTPRVWRRGEDGGVGCARNLARPS